MATVTTTYKTCDGCFKNDIWDGIEIVRSVEATGRTVDMCDECQEEDQFICKGCMAVVTGGHTCRQVADYLDPGAWR